MQEYRAILLKNGKIKPVKDTDYLAERDKNNPLKKGKDKESCGKWQNIVLV